MKNLSIIVAVYDVASYLRQCLESIYSQIDDSMEVILVDDGSTDSSLEVCEEFANNHSNTQLINKKHSGLSDTRNVGVEVATGEYLCFVDGDDWMAPDAIQSLLGFAKEYKCEVVQGGFYYCYPDYMQYDDRWSLPGDAPFVLENRDAMAELVKQKIIKNFVWGKLYLSDIVRDIPFRTGRYRQDAFWQHHVMARVCHYGVMPRPLYYYRQRPDSASGTFSLKGLDLLEGYEERLHFIKGKYPELIEPMVALLWKQAFQFNRIASNSSDESMRIAYDSFFKHVNSDFAPLVHKALHHDALYQISTYAHSLTNTYLFLKRVYDHLFAHRLLTIQYP
jgi:glycosyltransferase involved in cell wall biosynthesis